jgi:hypothetical protein
MNSLFDAVAEPMVARKAVVPATVERLRWMIRRRETNVPQCLQTTPLDHPSNGKPVVESQTERPTVG